MTTTAMRNGNKVEVNVNVDVDVNADVEVNNVEVVDSLSCMVRQERSYQTLFLVFPAGYQHHPIHEDERRMLQREHLVVPRWRQQMCRWCFDTVDHFGFDRDAVFLATHYLDRYFAHARWARKSSHYADGGDRDSHSHSHSHSQGQEGQSHLNELEFQLVGMTSLYVALKTNGSKISSSNNASSNLRGKRVSVAGAGVEGLSHRDFSKLSRGCFSCHDICRMERKLLYMLQWRLNPPTAPTFLHHLLCVMEMEMDAFTFASLGSIDNSNDDNDNDIDMESWNREQVQCAVYEVARYYMEFALLCFSGGDLLWERRRPPRRPSSIALASIHVALTTMSDQHFLSTKRAFRFLQSLSQKVITSEDHRCEVQTIIIHLKQVCESDEGECSSTRILSYVTKLIREQQRKKQHEKFPHSKSRLHPTSPNSVRHKY